MLTAELLIATLTSYQFWILALVTLFLIKKLTSKRYNLPPRPYSWPLIGNSYHVLMGKTLLYRWCQKVSKEVGPVFRISFGPIDAVVLNDLESTQKAMQQKGNAFNGRIKSVVLEVYSDGYNDVAMADPDDPTFASRRKLLATALRNFSSGRPYEKRISESLSKIFKLLDKFAENNESFDPETYFKLFTFNVMASMCFQKGYEIDDPEFLEFQDLLQSVNRAFSSGLPVSDLPLVKYLPFELWDVKLMRRMRDRIVEIIEREIEQSRKRGEDSGEIGDLTLYVLKTREEGQKEGLDQVTDLQITHLIGDIFGAGNETTEATFRWIILCLAINQDVQEKVYQEIIANVNDDEEFLVSAIDYKAKMPYSEAVVLETTRFGTVATMGVPHSTLCDTKIDDYDIPKGTMVIINHWAINHDENNFDDPEKFVPERFLDQDGKIGPRPKGYLPFGLGRRSCPGETTARTSVWITYVSLLKRYKILPPEGVELQPECKEHAFDGSPKPYKIVFERRT